MTKMHFISCNGLLVVYVIETFIFSSNSHKCSGLNLKID